MPKTRKSKHVERIQTGVRIEKRILKVLKAVAQHGDMTLGDLLEGIVLHALEGKTPFNANTLALIAEFKRLYGLDLKAEDSHKLLESEGASAQQGEEKQHGG